MPTPIENSNDFNANHLNYLGAELISAKDLLIEKIGHDINDEIVPKNAYFFLDGHTDIIRDDLVENYNNYLDRETSIPKSILGTNQVHSGFAISKEKWINVITPTFSRPNKDPIQCMAYANSIVCDGASGCIQYLSYNRVNRNELTLNTYFEQEKDKPREFIVFPLKFHPSNTKTISTMGKYYLQRKEKTKLESRLIDMLLGRLQLGIVGKFTVGKFFIEPQELHWSHNH